MKNLFIVVCMLMEGNKIKVNKIELMGDTKEEATRSCKEISNMRRKFKLLKIIETLNLGKPSEKSIWN